MIESIKKLNDAIGPNPSPRDLTEEEIELLRESKQEIASRYKLIEQSDWFKRMYEGTSLEVENREIREYDT